MSRYHKTYSPPIEKKTVQNKLNKGCCNYMDLFKKPTKKKTKRKEKENKKTTLFMTDYVLYRKKKNVLNCLTEIYFLLKSAS